MFVPLRVPDLGSYSVCTSCLRAGKPRTNEDAEEIAGHLTNVTSPASPLPLISCIPSYSLQSSDGREHQHLLYIQYSTCRSLELVQWSRASNKMDWEPEMRKFRSITYTRVVTFSEFNEISSVHCSELVWLVTTIARHNTTRRYLFPHSQIGSLVQLSSYIHIYSRDTLKLESWHNLVFIYRCGAMVCWAARYGGLIQMAIMLLLLVVEAHGER